MPNDRPLKFEDLDDAWMRRRLALYDEGNITRGELLAPIHRLFFEMLFRAGAGERITFISIMGGTFSGPPPEPASRIATIVIETRGHETTLRKAEDVYERA